MQRAVVESGAPKRGLRAPTGARAFTQTVQEAGERIALRTRGGEREITWTDYGELVDRFALGLVELGVKGGDVVAIMLTNSPEFHIADTACLSLGATPFSLYATLTPEQIAYQVSDSGAGVVVTEPEFLERVLAA